MNGMAPVYVALGGAALFGSALLVASCTSNPYYIGESGAAGGSAGAASTLSFAVDLNATGVSRLLPTIALPGGKVPATLGFHAENANASAWPSDQGARLLAGAASPQLGLETPFTDATLAVGFASGAAVYSAASTPDAGNVDSDDFMLELVLRAAPSALLLDKRGGGPGWSLAVAPSGVLTLTVADAQRSLEIASEALVANAWYYCAFWISRSAGGRADCDGRDGTLTPVGALGSLASSAPLSVGGATPANQIASELAYFSAFRVDQGGLGDPSSWSTLGRQRFAALTGISPRVAGGSPTPKAGLRNAAAYLDVQRDTASARRLFLVGPDWPRIACRSDDNGMHVCGYLSEPERTRRVDPEASAWTASELSVAPSPSQFADGEPRMAALIASRAVAPHRLGWTGNYAGARQALSLFARAESGQFLALSVGNHGAAVFDVRAGTVVTQPSGASATIEPWGAGLFRCAYLFTPEAVALSYQIGLANDASGAAFAGDGSNAFLDVAELQLDVGQAYPGAPLQATVQPADQLSFVADDGNLPTSTSVSQRMRVLLPTGPRLTDQAVLNLNRDGTFDNQVQVYVTGDTGELKFWGLREGATHWAFNHPLSVLDGLSHSIQADWGPSFAELSIDGVSLRQDALLANDPAFSLNRIDVSFSDNASSGSLEGLLGGIEIGAAATP